MSYGSPHSRPRLNDKAFAVLIAVLAASACFLLVAMRFGDPVRQARAAAHDATNLRKALPTQVEAAVEKRLGDLTKAETLERETRATVAKLETQLAALQQSVTRAESAAVQARRDAELAKLAAATGTPVQGSPQQAFASPAPEYQGATSTPEGNSATPTTAASSAGDVPRVLSARDGPFRIDLVSQRVTSDGIVLEFMLTKERDGDGPVEVYAPAGNQGVRIVTSEGIESNDGRITAPNGRSTLVSTTVALAEGVPSRFSILFRGEFQETVLCRRVELAVADRKNRARTRAEFRFDDVVATRY